MGAIIEAGNTAFRDKEVTSLPASGDHEVVKSEARQAFAVIDAALASIGVNGAITVKKATYALLTADLAHAADTLAVVYNDPTSGYNGIYAKVGGSGVGSWSLTALAIPASFADDIAEVSAQFGDIDAAVAATAADALSTGGDRTVVAADKATTVSAKVDAEDARDIAVAAAEASGNVNFYATKADANTALAGLPANAIVEVAGDESRDGKRTRYVKSGGVYVHVIDLPSYSDTITPNVAYVSVTGDDANAIVGMPGRPFRQVDAALDAVAAISGPVVIEVRDGSSADYNPATTDYDLSDPATAFNTNSKLRDQLTFRTPQRPYFNDTCTGLDGVAIPGPFFVDSRRKGFRWERLGVDSGKNVTDALYSGTAVDGLCIVNVEQDAGADPMREPVLIEPVAICRTVNSPVHAILVENTTGGQVVRPLSCYATHGQAYKSADLQVIDPRSYLAEGEQYIFKKDDYSLCVGVQLRGGVAGGSPPGTSPYATGTLVSSIRINPADGDVVNLDLGDWRIGGSTYGVYLDTVASGSDIDGLRFGSIRADSHAGGVLTFDGAGGVLDMKVGSIDVRGSTATIIYTPDVATTILRLSVGEIISLNSGLIVDMSTNALDITIGRVEVRSQAPGYAIYKLGTGRLRIGCEIIEPGSLAAKWHASSAPAFKTGWTDAGGSSVPVVNFVNYGVSLGSRVLQGGTGAARIMTAHGSLQPNLVQRFTVPGQLTAGGGTPCTVTVVVGVGSGGDAGKTVVDIEAINNNAATPVTDLAWVDLSSIWWPI